MATLPLIIFTSILALVLYAALLRRRSRDKQQPALPPGPRPWPIVGNLPHLGPKPHESMAALARVHGPIMHLKMGFAHVVVAASAGAAEQFLKVHDANFSSRPPNSGAKHVAYNYQDMVFAPYGPRWRLLRKISALHLFSGKALDDFRHIREEEVGILGRALVDAGAKRTRVGLGQMLSVCVTNALARVTLGKRVVGHGCGGVDEKAEEFKAMVDELMVLSGVFNIGDFIPPLEGLDLQGVVAKMKKLHKRFDAFLSAILEERKINGSPGTEGHVDLLSTLISLKDDVDDDEKGRGFTDTEIKAMLLACCDICGVEGERDVIITCCQCKINCEHMYCMRIPTEEYLNDWTCEECKFGSKQKPLASRPIEELPGVIKATNSVEVRNSGQLYSKKLRNGAWEKKVAKGKTKYIAANEAIKLSSGENKSLIPANFIRHSKPQCTEAGVKIFERTPIKPRNVPPGFPAKAVASGHLPQPKPQRPGNMEIVERARPKFKKLSEMHRSMSSLNPSQAPMKERMQEQEQQQQQQQQPREVQSPQTKPGILRKQTSSAPSTNASPSTVSGGAGRTTTELRASNAENVNNNLLTDLEACSCSPALDALWNGNFSIKDEHRPGELNHQIRAHPPSKVRRKIFEFSKKMPEVLDFQLVPLRDIWNNLFKEFSPDERDVGLYFFPSVGERSESYISLLESISVKNMALRKQIADVELLVFTSKLLPVNCQLWEGKYFLWGVFHRLKRDATCKPSDQAVENKEAEADMDIDMIGGIDVGRKDVLVKREPLSEKRVRFKEETPSAAKFKMNTDYLVPPGFESVCRPRQAQASSSVVANAAGAREGKKKEAENRNRLGSFPAKVNSRYLQFS